MQKVCGIVVSYRPGREVAANLAAVLPQVETLVVVDNGSSTEELQHLQSVLSDPKIHCIANPANLGIAHAFNQGIEYALARNYPWIATFDQDSCPPRDFISEMVKTWEGHPQREQVGLVAPVYHLGGERETDVSRPRWKEIPVAMASGNLIRAEAIRQAGLMDKAFFIDYVDFDFCLRLRRHGWRIIQANHAVLPHHLGKREEHCVFGITFSLVAHSALRRYYNSRNRLTTYFRHGARFPGWMLQDLAWWIMELGKILCFEADKGAKLRNVLLGLRDALRKRLGPAPPEAANV